MSNISLTSVQSASFLQGFASLEILELRKEFSVPGEEDSHGNQDPRVQAEFVSFLSLSSEFA